MCCALLNVINNFNISQAGIFNAKDKKIKNSCVLRLMLDTFSYGIKTEVMSADNNVNAHDNDIVLCGSQPRVMTHCVHIKTQYGKKKETKKIHSYVRSYV